MNPRGMYSVLCRYSREHECVGCRCSALLTSVQKEQILVQTVMSHCFPVAGVCRCVDRHLPVPVFKLYLSLTHVSCVPETIGS